MKALAELQRAFAAALFDEAHGDVARRVRPGAAAPERRLELYRRSVRASLHDALAATYPVVRRLVGDAFFREMARRYAIAAPSRSGDLHGFGGALGDFIGAYAFASALPYLADVARLEWACHECLHAPDAPPLDAAALSRVRADRQGDIRLRLHPAVRLVASSHPVVVLWEANQPDRDGTPLRLQGGDRALVWREAAAVRVQRVERAEWELLRALADGATLEAAVAAMGPGAAGRYLAPALERFGAQGVIAGFALPEGGA